MKFIMIFVQNHKLFSLSFQLTHFSSHKMMFLRISSSFSLKDDYLEAMEGVEALLMKRTPRNNLLYVGELLTGGKDFKPKMDHLTCYLPGTLALGVHYGLPKKHMRLAEDLAYTCYQTYAMQPTFLAPEISYFSLGETSENALLNVL